MILVTVEINITMDEYYSLNIYVYREISHFVLYVYG